MPNIDFDSYLSLVDEDFYGSREDWIAPNSFGQRNDGDDVFYNEYYPKYKIGKPRGMSDGRFVDYLDAGLIDRSVIGAAMGKKCLNFSPTYVEAVNLNMACIGFNGFHNDPADSEYGEPTDWTAYTELAAIHGNMPIMFQTYENTQIFTMSASLTGIEGCMIPQDMCYQDDGDFARKIQSMQSMYRYGPPVEFDSEEYTVICANQEERFALTLEDVNEKSYVYQEDTQSYYRITSRAHLDTEEGYTFYISNRDFYVQNNRPIVSFCPKNFIMEIRVNCTVRWSNGSVTTARPNSFPGYPSDTSSPPDGESLSTFLSKISKRVQDIKDYNKDNPSTSGYGAHLIVDSVWGVIYKRDERDKFVITQGGSSPYRPMPNVLFDNVFNIMGSVAGYKSYSGDYANYGLNQRQNTGNGTYFTVPIFGTTTTNGNGGNAYKPILISDYEQHRGFGDTAQALYWKNLSKTNTVLFGATNYYPKSTTSAMEGSFFYRYPDSSIAALSTWVWSVVDDEYAINRFANMCREGAATYGLFFCDDFNELASKNTPKVWTDEKLMCGTITMNRNVRQTWGDYTSGMDNMDQPQFWWVDSEGHTWNPETTFQTNDDDYPTMGSWNMVPLPVMPYPYPIYETANSYPNMAKWDTQLIGAFAGVKSLGSTVIPRTVTEIGYNAFAGTSLTEVTISENCEYSAESFPKNCEVKFYS